jgi:hypothetical protein
VVKGRFTPCLLGADASWNEHHRVGMEGAGRLDPAPTMQAPQAERSEAEERSESRTVERPGASKLFLP